MSYQGPPPTTPPPSGQHPQVVTAPPSPRRLPEQDHAGIDAAERAARRFTWLVTAGAAAVALSVAVVALLVRLA